MLPQLDVRHLYSVVVLAEELNFTRAAHRLRITQSDLSRQVTELEKQHGFHLFNRDRKRAAQLTDAGRTFVEEARSALLHADRAIHHEPLTMDTRMCCGWATARMVIQHGFQHC
jgi:DNA-binding transcriptional LysR family regulator